MVEALLNGFSEGIRAMAPALPGKLGTTVRPGGAEPAATDPLLCLLLWAALLHSEGRIDPKLLKHMGVDAGMFEALSAKHPELLQKLRWLRLAGMLFSRENICALLTARLAEMLMSATKASELLAITKTMERMPDWAWGEGVGTPLMASAENRDKQPQAGQRTGAINGAPTVESSAPAADAAMQQLREMLAEQSESGAEIDPDLIEKQQRLADRLDDFLVAPRPQVKSSTRGGKRTPGKQRRR